jgi:hypothetical protein
MNPSPACCFERCVWLGLTSSCKVMGVGTAMGRTIGEAQDPLSRRRLSPPMSSSFFSDALILWCPAPLIPPTTHWLWRRLRHVASCRPPDHLYSEFSAAAINQNPNLDPEFRRHRPINPSLGETAVEPPPPHTTAPDLHHHRQRSDQAPRTQIRIWDRKAP